MLPRADLLALLATALVCVLALPAAASAAEVLRIDDAVSDNYKASYNADPSRAELRTWLALRSISAAGTTWTPRPGGAITVTAPTVELHAPDGRRATLTASTLRGPVTGTYLRIDPASAPSRGRWGVLLTLGDRAALRSTPAQIALRLSSGGVTLATGTLQYRHDAAIAAAAPGHIEHNGPGGRWHAGAAALRTDWERAPATPTSHAAVDAAPSAVSVAPRITRLSMPLRTTRRTVALGVAGRAGSRRITHARIAIGARGFGGWTRIAPRYRLLLPTGARTHTIRVQLRAADGATSAVVARRVRCACG